jgi:geranylgeranyl transferase type-2 subunit beta
MGRGNYLQNLTVRLSEGVARLPEEVRSRQAAFLRLRQNGDGGFSGREGDSDLYYTGFALRCLAVLGALTPEVLQGAADYLRTGVSQPAGVLEHFSWLYASLLVQLGGGPDLLDKEPADWPERLIAILETFRTPDGGYARVAGASSGSTYHTFLAGLCYQLLGRRLPRPEETVTFILGRRREDGGFVEVARMRRSGTNPTAAAVGLLQVLSGRGEEGAAWTTELRDGVIGFLAQMPSDEGGLRANARVPLADLLSTFTGVLTLAQMDALHRFDTAALGRYVQALALPQGGFRGGLWDEEADVEYTFYGLGTLALLSL